VLPRAKATGYKAAVDDSGPPDYRAWG